MTNDRIYVTALIDQDASSYIQRLVSWLTTQGVPLTPSPLPPHLLLCGYPADAQPDVLSLTADAAAKTRSFSFPYTHVGITPDSAAVILAPEINRPLLALRERFAHSRGWPLHTPLFTISPAQLPQALPYVLPNVRPFEARVAALAVYDQRGQCLLHLPL